MKKYQNGYITIYLSLVIGILVMLFSTLLSGTRAHTMKFATECVMDMGLNSIFAEYHRAMFERYGLLFIDSSYGTTSASAKNTGGHLLSYMNLNFGNDAGGLQGKDLLSLRADNCELSGVTYASDGKGEVLRYQIGQLMKSNMLVDSLDNINNTSVDMDSLMNGYDSCCSERESANEQVDAIVDEMNSNLPEDEEPYSVSNPADAVETLGGGAILFYAIGDSLDIPMSYIDKSDYISERLYVDGAGLRNTQDMNLVTDKVLLISYVKKVCGKYKNIREGSRLNYQMEYLIANEDSDKENLEEIARYIFMTRYPINMAYLLTSASKRAEAEALALAASCAIANPELTEAIMYSILFAWGYAESAQDVRIIFDGHPIVMVKDDSSWNTPIEELVNFKAGLGQYHVSPGPLDYDKYLYGLLMTKSVDDITMRLMDIMEMDIRKTSGNTNFKMDNQIYQLTAEANVSSNYGGGYSIKRFYSYE